MMHFWEIRVLTPLSGTDVMFGIGTDNVDLTEYKFHFASALGSNDQSWAFSYEGKIHHNGQQTTYGQKFSQGCVVGILLDRSRGQLEFFLNRRSLGVAFTNICNDPHVKLYPMVCSTAAKSAIRLINASSQIECLQLRAFRAMSKQPKALEELKRMPGLRNILNNYWFLAPPVRYSQQSRNAQFDMLDEAVLSNKTRRGRKQKLNDDDIDMDDLYRNAHKIALHQYGESDDEPTLNEYFDEYFHYLLKALEELKRMPGLRNILNNYWFLAPPVRYSQQSRNAQFDMLDEAVLSNKTRRGRKQKLNDDDIDMDDLYRNAHKIALHQYGESDDEPTLNEYFDEYFHYLL
uniref:B30.2/SPRY domain-containing protein n=1 Tax=Stomoxys calcitrans TaxID=35570 RepID=A0A1I8PIK8_STOCA